MHPKKNTKIYDKVDLKPKSAVYIKGEKKLKCERACQIGNSKRRSRQKLRQSKNL